MTVIKPNIKYYNVNGELQDCKDMTIEILMYYFLSESSEFFCEFKFDCIFYFLAKMISVEIWRCCNELLFACCVIPIWITRAVFP